MRYLVKVCLILAVLVLGLRAQDRGAWIDYDLGENYSYDICRGLGATV